MSSSVSPARLSSLATNTLTRILELTRARQLEGPTPPASLSRRIMSDLSQLRNGIKTLESDPGRRKAGQPRDAEAESREEMITGLQNQYGRLAGLANDLGLEVEPLETPPQLDQSVTPRISEDADMPAERLSRTTLPTQLTHVPRIDFDDPGDPEEDEEAMRRANQDVFQMQRQMIDQQDETLDKLSQAISRQRDLSLTISSELELHSSLLDETDEAVDRTGGQLRKARDRLETVAKRARTNVSTLTIVFLIVLLTILILLLK